MSNRFYLKIFVTFIWVFMSNVVFAEQNSDLIPRRILFGNPDKTRVTLSPDGNYLTYLAPKNNVLNLWIAPGDDPLNAKVITEDMERGIYNYHWTYNSEYVLYSQDRKGDENYRIYSYNINTGVTRLLTPAHDVKAMICGLSLERPDIVLVALNERDKRYFDVYEIDLISGNKKLLLENNKFTSFVIDNDLQIRFATYTNKDGDEEYFQRKGEDWTPFIKVSLEDSKNTGFLGFDKSNKIVYLLDSRNRNTAALKAMNLDDMSELLIAESELADVEPFAVHPTEHRIQAVSIDYDKTSYNILDKSIESDLKYLMSLNNGELWLNSRTLDDKIWLVAFQGDAEPLKYYKYDRTEKKAEFLFSNRKALENHKFAEMHPIIIKSRDGMNLVSYLTLPIGATTDNKLKPSAPLPLILIVHGGPWARDSWGWSAEHQWLANRGYAVLSVNFRGSGGFGKQFTNAGNLQWGRKMHDDLIDGVDWAIREKIADPKKIAIMGGSYGGYAALAGLTFTPEIFACGIDIVGPSNLLTFIKSVPAYWEPSLSELKKRIGEWDSAEDIEALNKVSPLNFVDKITKPLFIAQGANDPRVKQAESDQIVKVMREKNIPVIYALYAEEGHGFVKAENRLSYYALIEEFLGRIMGGGVEPMGDDLLNAKLLLNSQNVTAKDAREIINNSIDR